MISNLNELNSVAAYLRRIGAEPRSLRTAVVKQINGKYWTDLAVIRFENDGKVNAPDGYMPTELEQSAIMQQFATAAFPELKKLKTIINAPSAIADAGKENTFEFRDQDGNIIMLQVRNESSAGRKYLPYTYWTDNQWRCMEPEGKLPLWGIEQLKDNTTVFLHEGAKAARAVRRMIEGKTPEARAALAAHPWGEELKDAAHIGWIGGALSPARTDWSPLRSAGIGRVYIVSDNDDPGVSAVTAIAMAMNCPTFHLQFTDEWPVSFDLADKFPESMFSQIGAERYYNGPSFRSCVHPATWATEQIPSPTGKGRPLTLLRESFRNMWAYAEEQDVYVCQYMPDIVRTESVLNKMISPFSHVNNTTAILQRSYRKRSTRLCYRPDVQGRLVTEQGSSAINMHTPGHIKPRAGDVTPFLEFMDYLIPAEHERAIVLDWCTALIAHPEVKMDFGLLMVSESQGVGKTTLGSSILAPLVGFHNTSHPSENMITNSDFNEWLANKRLVVVNEIYSGHSWKAYNKLKSIITDKTIDVNKKFQSVYTIENWAHIFACSNSMRALKMESDDRRWFYPEVTEKAWSKGQFTRFHNWLFSGGLSIIRHWAENRPTWVQRGDRAPMTRRKMELIEGSRTDGQAEAVRLAESINSIEEPVALAMKEIVAWVRGQVQGKVYDSDLELRKAMKEVGCLTAHERIKIFGMLQHVVLNNNPYWIGMLSGQGQTNSAIVKYLKKPEELARETM